MFPGKYCLHRWDNRFIILRCRLIAILLWVQLYCQSVILKANIFMQRIFGFLLLNWFCFCIAQRYTDRQLDSPLYSVRHEAALYFKGTATVHGLHVLTYDMQYRKRLLTLVHCYILLIFPFVYPLFSSKCNSE